MIEFQFGKNHGMEIVIWDIQDILVVSPDSNYDDITIPDDKQKLFFKC